MFINVCLFFRLDLINHSDLILQRTTVKCLHIMTTHGEQFWYPLLETGKKRENYEVSNRSTFYSDGIKRLVALLKSSDNDLILSVLSVLCNISTHMIFVSLKDSRLLIFNRLQTFRTSR